MQVDCIVIQLIINSIAEKSSRYPGYLTQKTQQNRSMKPLTSLSEPSLSALHLSDRRSLKHNKIGNGEIST
jgi:hypothetical protein